MLPDAGVVLVHYCEDEATRATCRVCPDATPDLAACHALQALAAAGVDHDPAEVWTAVRTAVAEQLTWRRTVAGLAAGEEVDEPTAVLARLVHAGGVAVDRGPLDWHGTWTDAVDQPTDRIVLPPGWREHTAPVPPADTTRHARPDDSPAAVERRAWARLALALAAIAVMVATAAAVVILTRPSWPVLPGHAPRGQVADPPAPAVDVGPSAGGVGPELQPAPRPGKTTTNPPTPTPAPSPSASPSGEVGGRTRVAPPPALSPSSSPAPSSPAPTSPAPTAQATEDPGLPAPSDSLVPPEPTPTTAESTTAGG